MSASDDDKPVDRPPTPDFSAQVADLPKSLPPKRGRGRPRKNPPAAKAARTPTPEPEPEPVPECKPPSPPPCPHVTSRRSPPLSVDSETESDSEAPPDPLHLCEVVDASTPTPNDNAIALRAARCIIKEQDEKLELFENTINKQNDELARLYTEPLRSPYAEDPDHTWDLYLAGTATGLAVGVLIRKVAAMLF